MEPKKTHREVKNPQMNARLLADFMAASDISRGTIIRKAKYQPLAPIVQHDEAKPIVSNFLRGAGGDVAILSGKAQTIRDRLADSDFDRLRFDYNADYIDRFATTFDKFEMPKADFLPGKSLTLGLNGVKVPVEVNLRLRRLTTTNKVRVGIAALRYAKGKALSPEVAHWHAALLYGALGEIGSDDGAEAELKLCLALDVWTGTTHAAPGDSITRFKNMKAACTGIVERWPNISPPANAVL
ncbi:MAG: hypothetical protein IV086_01800 [Hyphomonadaceae bacterium]|nr:hypothetical protein [Hyphomonadaceae bacterium]